MRRLSTTPSQETIAPSGKGEPSGTTSQKLIIRIAWGRQGVTQFEEAVNRHLAEGWSARRLSINKRGLRIVCCALLDRPC